jgi:hypothetical protein
VAGLLPRQHAHAGWQIVTEDGDLEVERFPLNTGGRPNLLVDVCDEFCDFSVIAQRNTPRQSMKDKAVVSRAEFSDDLIVLSMNYRCGYLSRLKTRKCVNYWLWRKRDVSTGIALKNRLLEQSLVKSRTILRVMEDDQRRSAGRSHGCVVVRLRHEFGRLSTMCNCS